MFGSQPDLPSDNRGPKLGFYESLRDFLGQDFVQEIHPDPPSPAPVNHPRHCLLPNLPHRHSESKPSEALLRDLLLDRTPQQAPVGVQERGAAFSLFKSRNEPGHLGVIAA